MVLIICIAPRNLICHSDALDNNRSWTGSKSKWDCLCLVTNYWHKKTAESGFSPGWLEINKQFSSLSSLLHLLTLDYPTWHLVLLLNTNMVRMLVNVIFSCITMVYMRSKKVKLSWICATLLPRISASNVYWSIYMVMLMQILNCPFS